MAKIYTTCNSRLQTITSSMLQPTCGVVSTAQFARQRARSSGKRNRSPTTPSPPSKLIASCGVVHLLCSARKLAVAASLLSLTVPGQLVRQRDTVRPHLDSFFRRVHLFYLVIRSLLLDSFSSSLNVQIDRDILHQGTRPFT